MPQQTQSRPRLPDDERPEFFRTLIEGAPEAVIVAKPDGEITYLNPACERLMGYPYEDVLGRNITMLVPQQPGRRADPVKWLERWAHEPDYTQSRFLDLIAQTRDGRQMPVDVRVVERALNGERRFFLTVRDNTARRQEQNAFKDAHLRATRILQIAEDGIVSVDANQNIAFFNLKAEAMFGCRAEDVLGKPLTALLPERFRARHTGDVTAFGAGKQSSRPMSARGEIIGMRRNGQEFPMEAAITKVMVGDALTYTAHLRDISERKEREAALIESERRFRAIFEHAFEAIGLLSPDGTVLEINRAGRVLTEGHAHLKGLPLWDLPWAGSDAAPDDAARQRMKSAIAAAALGQTIRYTDELRAGDAPPRKIDISFTPVKDETGRVIYIIPEGRVENP
jgi:PAS domain S-box-containing protein